ncbi:secretion system protein [Wolbachia pipientis]|uniref:Secretion system protein n=1 Tax=Wolbachia pipientis TaxID=955 RepID=A0A1E7QKE0_WOLPI|nr:secretion system protein [Wolbachia pipientis]OEY86941.1 secretion system protein [Wolbachia pipientis]
MIILKLLMLFFITSCSYLTVKQHDVNIRKQDNNLIVKDDSPEVIPLPIKFPDITNNGQLISINVNEETPIKELLIEIGKLADISLDIDPHISGNIILKLKDKSINEAIQSIAQSAKLRYSISNDVIRIEQDLPYIQNYHVDFINIKHSAKSNFIINNDLSNNDVKEGFNNVIKSQYNSNLWDSLEKGLSAIMEVNGVNDGEFFSSNRETGLIILNARKDIHKAIKEYISKVKKSAHSQIMVETKIVEITLNDKYLSGINLNKLQSSTDISDPVKSLKEFGKSTIISSTRLHAVNNQQAIVSFTENHIYFTLNIEKSNNKMLVTKANSVPVGIILIIHPSINADTGEIFMDVHPTLSRINGYTQDPGIEHIAQRSKTKLNSNIPIVEVKEMHSTLKIKSGEVMVIGGLIEHRKDRRNKRQKLTNNLKTTETVIFLKATIIPTFNLINQKDQNLYVLNSDN